MKFINWILHIFDCPEEDLTYGHNGKLAKCKKCGREHFVFKSY